MFTVSHDEVRIEFRELLDLRDALLTALGRLAIFAIRTNAPLWGRHVADISALVSDTPRADIEALCHLAQMVDAHVYDEQIVRILPADDVDIEPDLEPLPPLGDIARCVLVCRVNHEGYWGWFEEDSGACCEVSGVSLIDARASAVMAWGAPCWDIRFLDDTHASIIADIAGIQ